MSTHRSCFCAAPVVTLVAAACSLQHLLFCYLFSYSQQTLILIFAPAAVVVAVAAAAAAAAVAATSWSSV